MGIYYYTFDFDTFKNDTLKSVIFRYSQKCLLGYFDTFGQNFDFDTFKNGTFENDTFESVWVDRHPLCQLNSFNAGLSNSSDFTEDIVLFDEFIFMREGLIK